MSNFPASDGTERKSYYGDGKQPWDDIKEAGWAPQFAASNVLKYMRRTKEPEHSLASARWYWARLHEMGSPGTKGRAVLLRLHAMLSADELKKLYDQ